MRTEVITTIRMNNGYTIDPTMLHHIVDVMDKYQMSKLDAIRFIRVFCFDLKEAKDLIEHVLDNR